MNRGEREGGREEWKESLTGAIANLIMISLSSEIIATLDCII